VYYGANERERSLSDGLLLRLLHLSRRRPSLPFWETVGDRRKKEEEEEETTTTVPLLPPSLPSFVEPPSEK
jgi:hypothetical protein